MVNHYFRNKFRDFVRYFLEKFSDFEYKGSLDEVYFTWFKASLLWFINIFLAGVVTNTVFWFWAGISFTWNTWFFWGLSAWWLKHFIILVVKTLRDSWK